MQHRQDAAQGAASGRRDAGRRAAVTGGGHCTGFADLVCSLLGESGIPDAEVFYKRVKSVDGEPRRNARLGRTVLPGYFRPTKNWDLLVAAESARLGRDFPKDPADRIIAATARCHGLRLMTADENIRRWGKVPVI